MKSFLVTILFFAVAVCGTTVFGAKSLEAGNWNDLPKNGLVYVWSPKMPLSMLGIETIEKVAESLGLPLQLRVDPRISDEEIAYTMEYSGLPPQYFVRADSPELEAWGMRIHYPALFYIADGKIPVDPLHGYRGEIGYREWLAKVLTGDIEGKDPSYPFPYPSATPVTAQIQKITKSPQHFGYFDKPVWGTRWMSVHHDRKASLFFHLDTGQLVPLEYKNDTYVTPHDHLYTTFWAKGGTVGIMETREFLRKAENPDYVPTPLFVDRTLEVMYQSVGTLRMGKIHSDYRVLTGGIGGKLTFRDYRITHRQGDTPPRVEPLRPTGVACWKTHGALSVGLPMLSKDGLKISGVTSFPTHSLVLELNSTDPEICREVVRFSEKVSKAAISFDGDSMAFSRGESVMIYTFSTGRFLKVSGFQEAIGQNGEPVYPEFLEDGSLITPFSGNDLFFVEFTVPNDPAVRF